MTNAVSFSAVWQVVLPDGSVWIAPDSAAGSEGYIYAKLTANMVAVEVGGTVKQVFKADGSPMNGAR